MTPKLAPGINIQEAEEGREEEKSHGKFYKSATGLS
jgi:hypothetical protein